MGDCPVECINAACPEDDFIERNGTWLLTVIGLVTGCFGGMLTYFLKSRCRRIACMGLECERDVLVIDPGNVEVVTSSKGQ